MTKEWPLGAGSDSLGSPSGAVLLRGSQPRQMPSDIEFFESGDVIPKNRVLALIPIMPIGAVWKLARLITWRSLVRIQHRLLGSVVVHEATG